MLLQNLQRRRAGGLDVIFHCLGGGGGFVLMKGFQDRKVFVDGGLLPAALGTVRFCKGRA